MKIKDLLEYSEDDDDDGWGEERRNEPEIGFLYENNFLKAIEVLKNAGWKEFSGEIKKTRHGTFDKQVQVNNKWKPAEGAKYVEFDVNMLPKLGWREFYPKVEPSVGQSFIFFASHAEADEAFEIVKPHLEADEYGDV